MVGRGRRHQEAEILTVCCMLQLFGGREELTRIIDLEIMEEESSSESDGMDDFNSSSESDLHSFRLGQRV
ncbi:hypothetical protein R1flu_005187 [Riccia fluitans]|uniref:Uncharacterized protein n=1 Tax=Riccia fluitans TaxID=41844 RepID=A0ABD1YSG2_9MARC